MTKVNVMEFLSALGFTMETSGSDKVFRHKSGIGFAEECRMSGVTVVRRYHVMDMSGNEPVDLAVSDDSSEAVGFLLLYMSAVK